MENIKKLEESSSKGSILKVIKGSIVAIVITIISLFITALILTYTNVRESIIPVVIIAISSISILVGSILSTLHIRKNGLLNGALVGAIYMITIYLISSIAITGFGINLKTIIMFILCILSGIVGGIIGVNIQK